jgi:hypothetical protein
MGPKRNPPELEPFLGSTPSESTPVLLELATRQASRRSPADTLAQYLSDAYVAFAALDQRTLHRLDAYALEAAADYDAVQLSPVAPLGVCSTIAPTSQNRVLPAARGLEVVSDPTNVMALECAKRLRMDPKATVRLATIHQTLRAQPFPPNAGYSRHFRLFAMVEAGLGKAEDGFEVEAIVRAIATFDRLFELASKDGAKFPNKKMVIRSTPAREVLRDRAIAALRAKLPQVAIEKEPLDAAYYDGLRIMFGADSKSGAFVPIGDLGIFDWMKKLTGNHRQRLVASGFGLQLVPIVF